ncbi:MAG: hypothetical protein MHPSP_000763 [Paramarteilia canceri]
MASLMSHNTSATQQEVDSEVPKISNLIDTEPTKSTNIFSSCSPLLPLRFKSGLSTINVPIILLDGSEKIFSINQKAKAQELMDKVCVYLQIKEQEIFGLYFRDVKNRKIWLSLSSQLSSQMTDFEVEKWIFVFRVKFYPPDCTIFFYDITRYYITLQIRNDIISKKLLLTKNTLITFGAYIVQSELGDYSQEKHGTSSRYIDDFNFNANQSSEVLNRIALAHRSLRGLTPVESDVKLLMLASKISTYGLHQVDVLDNINSKPLCLSVNYAGLSVYDDSLLKHFFPWQLIKKIHSKRLFFIVEAIVSLSNDKSKHYSFRMKDRKTNKIFLDLVVEHHIFFRLKNSKESILETSLTFRRKKKYPYDGLTIRQKKEAKPLNSMKALNVFKDDNEYSLPIHVQQSNLEESKFVEKVITITPEMITNQSTINKKLELKKESNIQHSIKEIPIKNESFKDIKPETNLGVRELEIHIENSVDNTARPSSLKSDDELTEQINEEVSVSEKVRVDQTNVFSD